MSCDYNVHCVDCDDTHRFGDANHQDRLMHSLIKHRAAIAAMAPLAAEASVSIETSFGYVDARWFAIHAGHKLAVKSEYGDIHEQKCSACATESTEVRQVFFNWPHKLYCKACRKSIEDGAS